MALDISASDFATIVTKAAYVDKSLMIRDVYNASSRILITAPPRFGKSTNLDMIKRFFEIEADVHGNLKTIQTTNNYKLFKDYNLEICKDIGFFNDHFGKHPVVYIDFKPLRHVNDCVSGVNGCVSGVNDYAVKLVDALNIIAENSFNQHSYILHHSQKEQVFSGTTGFNVTDFRKYTYGRITKDETVFNLANSFNHLCTILKRFFKQNVFVLIDSYDVFLESPLFEFMTNSHNMRSFVESSICQLLNNAACVERVLITGVIPVIGEGFLSSNSNIECYHFLDSHRFTKYCGFTSAEIDTVLLEVIECDEERNDVKNKINDYYNAYKWCNPDICLYNIISVLQYVCRRRVKSYWCERRYIYKFKKCLQIEPIRQKLQKLLLGNELQLDTSQPLSITDVSKVNSMIRYGAATHVSIKVELFFVLFYHLGYLSVANDLGMGVVCVNIPSEEIKYEVAKAVFDENRELYSSPHMNGILSALDAFQPDATDLDQNCETFRKKMCNLYLNLRFPIVEIIEFIYVNLVKSGKYRRVMGHTFGPDGPTAVLLKNKHQMAICITYDCYGIAEWTHQKVINDAGGEHIFDVFNDVRGKVIIAIDCQCRVAYSYYFKTDDNLREVRTLPNIRTQ